MCVLTQMSSAGGLEDDRGVSFNFGHCAELGPVGDIGSYRTLCPSVVLTALSKYEKIILEVVCTSGLSGREEVLSDFPFAPLLLFFTRSKARQTEHSSRCRIVHSINTHKL